MTGLESNAFIGGEFVALRARKVDLALAILRQPLEDSLREDLNADLNVDMCLHIIPAFYWS